LILFSKKNTYTIRRKESVEIPWKHMIFMEKERVFRDHSVKLSSKYIENGVLIDLSREKERSN
jgi:hypothetical protein